MARLAVLASGNGTNFEAIAARLEETNHAVACLICDRQGAPVLLRAERRGIPAYSIPYDRSNRTKFELAAANIIRRLRADVVALAGFMRILTPAFVDQFPHRIVNIHPSLLPKFPGVGAIEKSYQSGDTELGVTVHFVDHGLDSGPIIEQRRFVRSGDESLEEVEREIHRIEHDLYSDVVVDLLNRSDDGELH